MKRLALLLLAVAALAAVSGYWLVNRWLATPLPIDGDVVFSIEPGSSFNRVSRALADAGVVERPEWLGWYARATGAAGQIHAGEYVITAGTTPETLLEQFVSGDVRLYSFTIVEGWNLRELLAALARHEAIESTLSAEDAGGLAEWLGSEHPSAEGLFLPETYRFARGTADREILRRAYDALELALDEEWQGRAPDLPLDSPYEALTLASIIEKETALASERPQIAGVFVRRLVKGMRLQTDPTVIYGIGESFDGNLTRRHLRTDTPYNTYTRGGLPPGPIAMPGRAAIHAALHPADGTTLYFVATGLGDGSHRFSDTREEHEAAVAEYLERERNRRQGDR